MAYHDEVPHRLDITQRLHQRMLDIVGTGLPLIASSMQAADLTGLAYLREEMVEAMDRYCRHVHQMRGAALSNGRARDQELSEFLIEGCVRLRGAYEAFRSRWAHREATNNWYEYRLSAIVMMKHVRDHVRRAEQLRLSMMKEMIPAVAAGS